MFNVSQKDYHDSMKYDFVEMTLFVSIPYYSKSNCK